jgi:hypothetical protein
MDEPIPPTQPMGGEPVRPTLPMASGPLDGQYPPRQPLGEGNYKQAFTTDDPNLVVRTVKPVDGNGYTLTPEYQNWVLDGEAGMLNQLSQDGIPTARVVARGTVTVDGQVRPADVVERYPAGSKGPGNNADVVNPDFLKYANENTLADLAQIRATLQAKGLTIADLQFMIKPDGHVVVADPLGVYNTADVPKVQPDWVRAMAERSTGDLTRVEDAVRATVESRAAAPTH